MLKLIKNRLRTSYIINLTIIRYVNFLWIKNSRNSALYSAITHISAYIKKD